MTLTKKVLELEKILTIVAVQKAEGNLKTASRHAGVTYRQMRYLADKHNVQGYLRAERIRKAA